MASPKKAQVTIKTTVDISFYTIDPNLSFEENAKQAYARGLYDVAGAKEEVVSIRRIQAEAN